MSRQASILIALAVVVATPSAASAADGPRVDPRPGSPSEAVYGIQLDRERRDAAPGGRSGQASRSELGVGSSAVVPGTAKDVAGPGAQSPPEGGGGSGALVYGLLVLVALAAAGGGFMATSAARRANRST